MDNHQLSHLLEAEPDVAAAVSDWIDGLRQSLTADPRDGCPVMPTAVESIAASPRLRAAATRAFDSWQSVLAARLRQLGWSRRAAADHATALISLIEGRSCSRAQVATLSRCSRPSGSSRTSLPPNRAP